MPCNTLDQNPSHGQAIATLVICTSLATLENSGGRVSKSTLQPYPADARHHSDVLTDPRGHSLIRHTDLKGPGLEHARLQLS